MDSNVFFSPRLGQDFDPWHGDCAPPPTPFLVVDPSRPVPPKDLRRLLQAAYLTQRLDKPQFRTRFRPNTLHPYPAKRVARRRKTPYVVDLSLIPSESDDEYDPNDEPWYNPPVIAALDGEEYEFCKEDGSFWDSDDAYESEFDPTPPEPLVIDLTIPTSRLEPAFVTRARQRRRLLDASPSSSSISTSSRRTRFEPSPLPYQPLGRPAGHLGRYKQLVRPGLRTPS